MYMNLILLFICINMFLPLANINGLPFANSSDCYFDETQLPSIDPAMSVNGSNSNTNTVLEEMRSPTHMNGTISMPWDPIAEPFEMLYQTLMTAKDFVLGGYITGVIDSFSSTCVTVPDSDPMHSTIGYKDKNIYSPTYGQNIYKTNLIDGADNTCSSTWTAGEQTTCFQSNVVLEQLKIGVNVLMGFLIIFLIFYWVTGKGHLITS